MYTVYLLANFFFCLELARFCEWVLINNTTLLIKGEVVFFFLVQEQIYNKDKRIKTIQKFQRIAMNSKMANFINVYPLKLIVD